MPVTRPDGKINYLPHEAYMVVGHRNYGPTWQERFSNQPALPDLGYVLKIVERGGQEADRFRHELEQGTEQFDIRQAQRRHEWRIFNSLIDALSGGKTEGWTANWEPIPYNAWMNDPALIAALREDIYRVFQTEAPTSGITIAKAGLDRWMDYPLSKLDLDLHDEPKQVGRPPDDWDWFGRELERLSHGEEFERGWRECVCIELRRRYILSHPGLQPGRVPSAKTIRQRLKPLLDIWRQKISTDKLS